MYNSLENFVLVQARSKGKNSIYQFLDCFN